jgi:hypothetical protein
VQLSSAGGNMYHATKWGIEGFLESVMLEVASFGIEITLVEPGVARTGFGTSLDIAPALAAYADTSVGQARQYIEAPEGITANGPGDPDKIGLQRHHPNPVRPQLDANSRRNDSTASNPVCNPPRFTTARPPDPPNAMITPDRRRIMCRAAACEVRNFDDTLVTTGAR